MTTLDDIQFPDTRQAKSVYNFVKCQQTKDFSNADYFTEDVHVNGLAYQVSGKENVAKMYGGIAQTAIESVTIEAICESHNDTFLLLLINKLKENGLEVPVASLVWFEDGLISRVDGCYDVAKMTSSLRKDAEDKSKA